jgi:hypothetical protein
MDGNLHWCPAAGAKVPEGFLEKVRAARGSKAIQAKYPGGWESRSFVANPHFMLFDAAETARNDYRLKKDSPASGKGVVLPKELPDMLRPEKQARPDIGALPVGSEPMRFGRHGRIALPVSGRPTVSSPGALPGKRPLVLVRNRSLAVRKQPTLEGHR